MLLAIWSAVGRSNSSLKCSGVAMVFASGNVYSTEGPGGPTWGNNFCTNFILERQTSMLNYHFFREFWGTWGCGFFLWHKIWYQADTPELQDGTHNCFLERSLILQGFWKIFRGHVEFQGGLPWLHFFLMNNPKKKSNQGFDFQSSPWNLPIAA